MQRGTAKRIAFSSGGASREQCFHFDGIAGSDRSMQFAGKGADNGENGRETPQPTAHTVSVSQMRL